MNNPFDSLKEHLDEWWHDRKREFTIWLLRLIAELLISKADDLEKQA